MYPASLDYLNRQRIIPNWGSGLWEQRYIYIYPLFSFCESVCVCFCVWFGLYSFAFTNCPRVLSVCFLVFVFSIVFSACYQWWIYFLVWLLSSFFLSFFLFFITMNTPLSLMDRSSKMKINKETQALNDTLNKMDLIDIYRTFHPKTAEYNFFSTAHGTFSRIDHILGHKSSLGKFKKIEIISNIFLTRMLSY